MNDQTRREDKEEKHEGHDKITELITITHKSTYGHSEILVHLVAFDHLQITKAVSRRTLMHLLLPQVRNRADISLSKKMAIRSTTGVMSPPSQPKRELLLSKYITHILATFAMILPTRTWKYPQKLYGLLLALWVRHLASTRTKTPGDPPFARNS